MPNTEPATGESPGGVGSRRAPCLFRTHAAAVVPDAEGLGFLSARQAHPYAGQAIRESVDCER